MIVAAAILTAFAVFTLLYGNASENRGPAPAIAINTAKGPLKLSDLKGKVVLVDFWATWCGPCKMSIPGIQKLYSQKKKDGFEVLGVAMEDDNGEGIPAFVRKMGMTYPVGMPVERESVQKYVDGGIPTMALVDKSGNLRWKSQGYSEEVEAKMGAFVVSLLKE
jgi:cytochrome c biogenesis protein CcmG/thiol:disulfide interchange protein DsbE